MATVIDLCSDSDSADPPNHADSISDSDSDGFPSLPSKHPHHTGKTKTASPIQPKPAARPSLQARPNPTKNTHGPEATTATAHPSNSRPTPAFASTPRARPATESAGDANRSILDSLNAAQRRAVTSKVDTVAILAGPGSGKTHTLTSRVVWLVDRLGYRPQDVIVATFTVKAAREMKERIGKVLGDERARRIVLGTFHSVARRYLASYGKRIGLDQKFSIVDDADSRAIITRIIKRLNFTLDTGAVRGWISQKKAKGRLGEAEEETERQKKKQPPTEMMRNRSIVYQEYQDHLRRLNLLDYDDLLVQCAELLRQCPSCVANVQAVLIDEYQDTNGIQYELMKLLGQGTRRITIVGDPDQSIYGWRSAEIKNLHRFLQDFPGTDEISLEENYRSSRSILDTSLAVIQQDAKRYKKSLLPIHKKGARPVLRKLLDNRAEAEWIVGEIQRAMLLCGGMMDLNDVAILVRSALLARPIEACLGRAGVPYRMMGGRKFFERAEVKLLLDYLRVIHQPHDNDSLVRVVNTPRRGVGDKTLKALLEEAETENMSLWTLLTKNARRERTPKTTIKDLAAKRLGGFVHLVEGLQALVAKADLMREARGEVETKEEGEEEEEEEDPDKPKEKHYSPSTFTLVKLIESLVDKLNYRAYLERTYGPEEEGRWANVEELVNLAGEFMANYRELEDEDELPEVEGVEQEKETSVLAKFLANVSLSSGQEDKDEDMQKPVVTISTIHAAKGLEWPVVFIPAAYNGSLPHARSEDNDEERRLLYVAMTRAKCLLNISYSITPGWERSRDRDREGEEPSMQELSVFLDAVPAGCFLEQGPSYNRGLLEEMGDILGRAVPCAKDIFQQIPAGSPTEDDRFPIDPEKDGQYDGGGRPSKRQRFATAGALGNVYNGQGGSDLWQRGYTTTMEGGNFSMGSMPGFVSASVHHTALLAEAAEAEAKAAKAAKNKRPAVARGQSTILHAFARQSGGEAKPEDKPFSAVRPLGTAGIPPELTGRKLGGGIGPKTKLGHPSTMVDRNTDTKEAKRYAHFSSSPTREDTASLPLPQSHRHTIRPGQVRADHLRGKENQSLTGSGVCKGGITAAASRPRPAASFHTTSYAQATAMDQLRKPFKPPRPKKF